FRVGELRDLHLPDHPRLVRRGREPAALTRDLGGERNRRDHRRLFDRHRHHHVLAVDEEVEPDPDRQPEHADGVLDHPVRVGERRRGALAQTIEVLAVERVGQAAQPFRHLHLVEARQPAGAHPLSSGEASVPSLTDPRISKTLKSLKLSSFRGCTAYMKAGYSVDEIFEKVYFAASPALPDSTRAVTGESRRTPKNSALPPRRTYNRAIADDPEITFRYEDLSGTRLPSTSRIKSPCRRPAR